MSYRGNLGCLWILLLALLIGGTPLLVGVLRLLLGFFVIVTLVGWIGSWWLRRQAIGQYTSSQTDAHNRFVESLVLLLTRLAEVDGDIDRREVSTIRRFFERSLGYRGERLLWVRDLIKEARGNTEPVESICEHITSRFGLQERFIVMQVLVAVARADGRVSPAEQQFIDEVGVYLGLRAFLGGFGFGYEQQAGAGAARANGAGRVSEALATLGVSSDASPEEVKKAWRKLSLENHPDRVKHLGEEFTAIAEKRMREINVAYDVLKEAGRA